MPQQVATAAFVDLRSVDLARTSWVSRLSVKVSPRLERKGFVVQTVEDLPGPWILVKMNPKWTTRALKASRRELPNPAGICRLLNSPGAKICFEPLSAPWLNSSVPVKAE